MAPLEPFFYPSHPLFPRRMEAGPAVPVPEALPRYFHEVVPGRAVLTELARGFLLAHASDAKRATEFAVTFLREWTTTAAPPRPVPLPRLTLVRRGAVRPTREPAGSPRASGQRL